jgi:hypothetical protein
MWTYNGQPAPYPSLAVRARNGRVADHREFVHDSVNTSAFSVSTIDRSGRRELYERLQRRLLAHLVFEHRCRFVPRDAVAQAKERTLHDDMQQQRR